MITYLSINPFRKYAKPAHDEAVAQGIVRDVSKVTRKTASAVSRTFAGETKRPNAAVVEALNAWLTRNGFPVGDPNGRATARNLINELRKKSTSTE